MAPTLFNTETEQIENYKGHAEILDTGVWFKSDSLLSWTVLTRADSEKHYGTNGNKKKTSVGDSSTFEMRVKAGADWYSLADGTEVRTITAFKKLIYGSPARAASKIETWCSSCLIYSSLDALVSCDNEQSYQLNIKRIIWIIPK